MKMDEGTAAMMAEPDSDMMETEVYLPTIPVIQWHDGISEPDMVRTAADRPLTCNAPIFTTEEPWTVSCWPCHLAAW